MCPLRKAPWAGEAGPAPQQLLYSVDHPVAVAAVHHVRHARQPRDQARYHRIVRHHKLWLARDSRQGGLDRHRLVLRRQHGYDGVRLTDPAGHVTG